MTNATEKTLFLSGGGGSDASYPLDSFFFKSVPRNGSLLYIPIALRGHKLFNGARDWFTGVMKLHDRYEDIVLEVWDEFNGKDFSKLRQFDAIYVGGGNTWILIKEITESGFRQILRDYIERGGVYYGGSAGAIICGSRLDTHQDENTVGWRDMKGMDVLNGLSVACHVTSEQLRDLEIKTKESGSRLLALEEDAGAIIKGDSYHCVGKGICKEF